MSNDVTANKPYWDKFYAKMDLSVPSQFCVMVATEIPQGSCVLEFGCGNGRDSLYLASQRHKVCATDLSAAAVKKCQTRAEELGFKDMYFSQGDLSNLPQLKTLFEKGRELSSNDSIIGYSRFVMHSMNDEQEDVFLENLGMLMRAGETMYFEFRSKEDANLEKTFGNHYRRFVDTDVFIEKMRDDFDLKYQLTGQGMAKYKAEDPFVSRLIFEKS